MNYIQYIAEWWLYFQILLTSQSCDYAVWLRKKIAWINLISTHTHTKKKWYDRMYMYMNDSAVQNPSLQYTMVRKDIF